MRILSTENGAALITALLLTLLSLVIATALLYTVTASTKVSASHKRYRNALAAAHGGVQVLMGDVVPKLLEDKESFAQIQHDFADIRLQFTDSDNKCMKQKVGLPTSQWSFCADLRKNADPAASPDLTFRLSGVPVPGVSLPDFVVSTKITDTVPGNTNTSIGGGNLGLMVPEAVAGEGVGGGGGTVVAPEHVPFLYTVVVQGERGGAAPEKARLSVLYAN